MNRYEKEKINLDGILRNHSYDHAILCTYTFDADFFEEYSLNKFEALRNNGNVTVIVDFITYQKSITGATYFRPKQANLRYLFCPISVSGAFHAKLFLFVSKTKGRLIVGSANFTRPGLTSNAELVGCYDFEVGKNENFHTLFTSAFRFLVDLNHHQPSWVLSSNLATIERDAPWLTHDKDIVENSNLSLIHNLHKPLWDQIIHEIEPPIDSVYILSRYFDSSPDILDKIAADTSTKKIKIFTQNGITTLTKDWLSHRLFKERLLEIMLCSYMDDGYLQPLHAKAMIFEKNGRCMLVFGSANFTTPALFRVFPKGNVETVVIVKDLSARKLQSEKLFDPLSTAVVLKAADQLQPAPKDTHDVNTGFEIFLREAMLSEKVIRMSAKIPDGITYDSLFAKVKVYDGGQVSMLVNHKRDDEYVTENAEQIAGGLYKEPCLITLEAIRDSQTIAASNPLLITNLLDIHTGQNVKRERRIREAQQSAIEFFKVLTDMIDDGDEQSLIAFFNFCNIPLIDAARPVIYRGTRPAWDGGQGMRSLGEKNLKIFTQLHEAAINFFDRHLKKLGHHTEYGGINGIANYLHIFLAMGAILRSQVERAMQGFEAKDQPLSADEWYDHRQRLDAYFRRFDQLMECLHGRYLPHLLKLYQRNDIRERFTPDTEALFDLCIDMLAFKDRCEFLVNNTLKIRIMTGNIVIPPFNDDNIFNHERWPEFEKRQQTRIMSVLREVAA
jgi:HKD family nuclease